MYCTSVHLHLSWPSFTRPHRLHPPLHPETRNPKTQNPKPLTTPSHREGKSMRFWRRQDWRRLVMRRRLGRSPLVQNPNPDLRSSASSPENSKNSNPYPTSTIETRRSLPPIQLTRRVSPAKQTKEVTRGTDTPGLSRSLLSVFLRCTRLELHAGPTIPPAVRQLHMALCVRNFDE